MRADIWKLQLASNPAWKVFEDGDPLRTLIDIRAARGFFTGLLPLCSREWIGRHLGLGKHDAARLTQIGMFQPIQLLGSEDRPPVFSQPAVKAVISASKLFSAPRVPIDEHARKRLVNLVTLSIRFDVELLCALKLIEAGRMAFFVEGPISDLGTGIWVDPIEALSEVLDIELPMTLDEVSTELGLSKGAIRSLAQGKIITAYGGVWRGKGVQFVFDRRDVERFRSMYVTYNELRKSESG